MARRKSTITGVDISTERQRRIREWYDKLPQDKPQPKHDLKRQTDDVAANKDWKMAARQAEGILKLVMEHCWRVSPRLILDDTATWIPDTRC